ncbi:hypothetical protein [Bordetella sp. N]|uniref:hypothetical protein n=1 Tax=Bordetella sp. N TaxID=1746199 RepID=UPI00070DFEA0|nr:hypothetical protein [Bordetella sp. N]ALM82023.1 hypothetical protein ASB57_02715 [Bordetella sp. N]
MADPRIYRTPIDLPKAALLQINEATGRMYVVQNEDRPRVLAFNIGADGRLENKQIKFLPGTRTSAIAVDEYDWSYFFYQEGDQWKATHYDVTFAARTTIDLPVTNGLINTARFDVKHRRVYAAWTDLNIFNSTSQVVVIDDKQHQYLSTIDISEQMSGLVASTTLDDVRNVLWLSEPVSSIVFPIDTAQVSAKGAIPLLTDPQEPEGIAIQTSTGSMFVVAVVSGSEFEPTSSLNIYDTTRPGYPLIVAPLYISGIFRVLLMSEKILYLVGRGGVLPIELKSLQGQEEIKIKSSAYDGSGEQRPDHPVAVIDNVRNRIHLLNSDGEKGEIITLDFS